MNGHLTVITPLGKHTHITKAEHYTIIGGDKESHGRLQDITIKICKKMVKHRPTTTQEFKEIIREAEA